MHRSKHYTLALAIWLLVSILGVDLLGEADRSARAAPQGQASNGIVVISEFRTTGPAGGNDEYVEIYNRTNSPIDIGGWLLQKSSSNGSLSGNPRYKFPAGYNLLPGQRYLVVGASYSGSTPGDTTTALEVADNGGIALIRKDGVVIDAVGMTSGSAYLEKAPLAQLSGNDDQSYERKNGGCTDTNDNSTDFILQAPSNPQNSTSIPIKCLKVTNVTSISSDGLYISGDSIAITVEFSSNVNVTGKPTLLLETGSIDRTAKYLDGSGSNVLTFNYTVKDGDVSSGLDYIDTNSLSLNGGSITGAVGDADLTLPSPGTTGSLGANKAIVIDDGVAPTLVSFKRQNPSVSPTNATILTFRVTFSKPVLGVDGSDFFVTGTTATVTSVKPVTSSVYDVIISGGDLGSQWNGAIGLDLADAQDISDVLNVVLPDREPETDEIYILDKEPPAVSIEQATDQADPDSEAPVRFVVTFSEQIDGSTFTASDIIQSNQVSAIPSSLIKWNITDSGNHQNFSIFAVPLSGVGTITPSINAGGVKDIAGNSNLASTSTDNTVYFNDNVPPSVTVNRAAGQSEHTDLLPIKFTVVFSEPIIASIFTANDISQTGTAKEVAWEIVDLGDQKTFTISAVKVSEYGTLIPLIAANSVTDLVGNNNTASIGTDSKVQYLAPKSVTSTPAAPATRTETVPPGKALSIIINEVAWAGTKASSDDEWIELYNPTAKDINLKGWKLQSSESNPSPDIAFKEITIKANGYLLLERSDDDATDVPADIIYSGSLSNTGKTLRLYDANGTLIDSANGNGGAWPAGIASTYSSMQRSLVAADSDRVWVTYEASKDSGARARDAGGNEIMGTPGRANRPINVTATSTPIGGTPQAAANSTPAPQLPPILGISEFLPRPGYDWNKDGAVNALDEFIEIINAGQIDVNLNAYQLDDEEGRGSVPYPLPKMTLQPGERAVFFAAQSGILLSDAGDTVRLLKGQSVVDAYTYPAARAPDLSWCRLPDRMGPWSAPCFPTPNNFNALTGTLPQRTGPLAGSQPPVCLLPDTAPPPFLFAECPASGMGIWNRQHWDQADAPGRLHLDVELKWEMVFE